MVIERGFESREIKVSGRRLRKAQANRKQVGSSRPLASGPLCETHVCHHCLQTAATGVKKKQLVHYKGACLTSAVTKARDLGEPEKKRGQSLKRLKLCVSGPVSFFTEGFTCTPGPLQND